MFCDVLIDKMTDQNVWMVLYFYWDFGGACVGGVGVKKEGKMKEYYNK